jgi:hypothetical protein
MDMVAESDAIAELAMKGICVCLLQMGSAK